MTITTVLPLRDARSLRFEFTYHRIALSLYSLPIRLRNVRVTFNFTRSLPMAEALNSPSLTTELTEVPPSSTLNNCQKSSKRITVGVVSCTEAATTESVSKIKIANALSKCSCKVVTEEKSLKQLVILFGFV